MVIRDDAVVDHREGGILVDVQTIVGTASLGRVTRAGHIALALIDLRTVDGSSTETLGIVFETSVSVIVAFAESNTCLDGHVLGIGTLVKESIWIRIAEILETSGVDERSEVGARRLRRLLVTLDEFSSVGSGIDTRKESEDRRSSSERLEGHHGGGTIAYQLMKVWETRSS